jgi:hypothetical protein
VKSTFFQLIAVQLSRKVEELEMYIRMDHHHGSAGSMASSTGEFDGLERLREDKLLSDLHPSCNGDLVKPSLEINLLRLCLLIVALLIHCTLVFNAGVAICFENSRLDQF